LIADDPVFAMIEQDRAAISPLTPSVLTKAENRTIKKAMTLIERKCLREGPIIDCADDLKRNLILRFAGLTHEQFHVLYLDRHCRLLAAYCESFGHQHWTPVNLRTVILRAIALGADSVVLAHNHPSGGLNPSEQDIRLTKSVERILGELSIDMVDHFIVTSRNAISVKLTISRREEEEQRPDR
jgi:DNA repair protein RadC